MGRFAEFQQQFAFQAAAALRKAGAGEGGPYCVGSARRLLLCVTIIFEECQRGAGVLWLHSAFEHSTHLLLGRFVSPVRFSALSLSFHPES